MLPALIRIEARKLVKHPFLWLGLLGLVLFFTAYFAIRYALIASSVKEGLVNTRGLELDLQIGLALFSFVSILFHAAAASLICGADSLDRSIQMWLLRGVPRPLLLLARMIMVLGLGLLLSTAALVSILGLASGARMIFLGSVSLEQVNFAEILPAIFRIFWAAAPYLALTVLLAVAGRSPLVAAGGTLLFRMVFENLLAGAAYRFPGLARFLPMQMAAVLEFNTCTIDRAFKPLTLQGEFLTEPQAILMIGLLVTLMGGLSMLIFSRQDRGG
ncbi:MAG TPA: hypothetical protein PKW33_10445 [Anaerolineaceae bacterium]|nr:hypothetical protein [Anaerolineaceae bacterium]HPN51996.1 hypothetical protein [Anaerolineaceae bacterium]